MPALLRKKKPPKGRRSCERFSGTSRVLSYINKGNPAINIVFESLADGEESALPEAHTCEQELGIPSGAYEAKLELLEHYLDLAIAYCSVRWIWDHGDYDWACLGAFPESVSTVS
jgi:hypothetical protein